MPASRYTPEQRTEALKLYEAEGPSAVEKKLGIPKGTVTGWAKAQGVGTVRNERTREATEAAQEDNKLRRQRIIRKMYDRAEFVADRLSAPVFKALVPVAPGRQEPQELDFVPATEERALSGAVSSYLSNALNLEAKDTDNGVQGAVSMLDRLIEQIGVTGDSGVPEAAPVPAEE